MRMVGVMTPDEKWAGVDEQAARRLGARAICKARKEGRRGFSRPLEILEGVGFVSLMYDDVETAREYARAAVLVEESRDRGFARSIRDHRSRAASA